MTMFYRIHVLKTSPKLFHCKSVTVCNRSNMSIHLIMVMGLLFQISQASLCNLNGNWTNHRRPNGQGKEPVVHIEFFQEANSKNFTLRTTPWGSSLSYGHVIDATHVTLLMVGGGMEVLTIAAGSTTEPSCTQLSSGWCKFPYCGFPEPHWPAWSPPEPPPPPAPPSPPAPTFPPPTWTPTWNLTESTTIQPSSPGFFDPNHTWGLISLDWSVAKDVWMKNGRNHTNCEAVSTEGCRRLKASGKAHKCFIYHNMELALEWEVCMICSVFTTCVHNIFIRLCSVQICITLLISAQLSLLISRFFSLNINTVYICVCHLHII